MEESGGEHELDTHVPARPRRRRGLLAALVALAVVAGLVASYLVWSGGSSSYPSKWDPRVAAIAKFDEKTRGLKYDHPVPVAFLPDKQFRKEVTRDEKGLTKEDRKQLQQSTKFLRALGLVSGNVDLFKETNKLQGETVLAFYDPDRKRVRVRGTKLDPATRVTVAHELTHVLQDQHFDLNKTEDRLDSDARSIFRAIVEGDATDVEDAYIAKLSRADKAAYEKSQQDEQQKTQESTATIPEVLQVLQEAPYVFGSPLIAVLRADGGVRELNRAFSHPPVSDEQLMDPRRFLAHDKPKKVARPQLARGEKKVDSGTMGAIGWYVMLASRIDPKEALTAVDGWGGDKYVSFERGKTTCVRAAYRGDTRRDTDEMHAALTKWVAAMPAHAGSLRRSGGVVTLESCDPGASTEIRTGSLSDAMALPVGRVQILGEFVKDGAPIDLAMCVSDKLVRALTPQQLSDETGSSIDPTTAQNMVKTFAAQCRA
ncbi:MAG: hypothetical protein U0V73_10280 [Acidimicrobiia bacterium]